MPSPRRALPSPRAPTLREPQSQSHFTKGNNEAVAGGLGTRAGQQADAWFPGALSLSSPSDHPHLSKGNRLRAVISFAMCGSGQLDESCPRER